MARLLFTTKDRDAAHQYQAAAIANGSAPEATCTEHPEHDDVIAVWDASPSGNDFAQLRAQVHR